MKIKKILHYLGCFCFPRDIAYGVDKYKVAKRKKPKKIRIACHLLCLMMGCTLSITSFEQKERLAGLKSKLKRKETEFNQLSQEKKELKRSIQLLHSDEYIGELARKEYFLSGQNEIIFVLPKIAKQK